MYLQKNHTFTHVFINIKISPFLGGIDQLDGAASMWMIGWCLCHYLAWLGFLIWVRSVGGTNFVETAGWRATNKSPHYACTRLEIVCNSFYGNEVAAPLHRRACTGNLCGTNRVFEHQWIRRCARDIGVLTSAYTFEYRCIKTGVFEHQWIRQCARDIGVLTSAYTLAAGCEYALVYVQFVH